MALVYAFACGFFSVDFSIWPLLVGAGKTQSDVAVSWRASIKRAVRSQKEYFKAPSRTYSQRRRKDLSGLRAQSPRRAAGTDPWAQLAACPVAASVCRQARANTNPEFVLREADASPPQISLLETCTASVKTTPDFPARNVSTPTTASSCDGTGEFQT